MRLVLLLIAAALLLVPAARAGHPNTFAFHPSERWLQTCNDEESPITGTCVTDPMGCTWGDEDDVYDAALGKLSAGVTVSDTLCLVTDICGDAACPHFVVFEVDGPPGLAVSLTDDRGFVWQATPIREPGTFGGPYVYAGCFPDPLYTGDRNFADYPPIIGTDGGVGFVTNYTLHVESPKTSNQVVAGLEVAQNNADGRFGYQHQLSVPCIWVGP